MSGRPLIPDGGFTPALDWGRMNVCVVPFVSVAEMTAMPPQSRGVRGNPILATPGEAVNGTGGGIGCSKSGLRSAGSQKFLHCPGEKLVVSGMAGGPACGLNRGLWRPAAALGLGFGTRLD